MKEPIHTPNNLEELDVYASRLSQAMGDVFDAPISAKKQQKLREVVCRTFGYPNGLQSVKACWESASTSAEQTPRMIHRLRYDDAIVVTLNGELMQWVDAGDASDRPYHYEYVKDLAPEELRGDSNAPVIDVELPAILGAFGGEDPHEIVELARKLGYFKYEKPFYQHLVESHIMVAKNGYGELIDRSFRTGGFCAEFTDRLDLDGLEFLFDNIVVLEAQFIFEDDFDMDEVIEDDFCTMRWTLNDIANAHYGYDQHGVGRWYVVDTNNPNERVALELHSAVSPEMRSYKTNS